MARIKEYKAKNISSSPELQKDLLPADLMIKLPPNPRGQNLIDLRPWTGQGFDNWIKQTCYVLNARLQSGNYSPATIASLASNGLNVFLPYLIKSQIGVMPASPSDLKLTDVVRYIAWLKLRYPNGATAKNYYTGFKSLLVGLMDYGFINLTKETLLPRNPFPMSATVSKKETPLSQLEMHRLATALKTDLIAIHHNNFSGLDSEAIVVLLLIIGMRSGINITPLVEMNRDCLAPHPFMPNLMLVRTFKRRGKGAQTSTLKQTELHENDATIPMDGVAVLKKALELTQELVAHASLDIKDRLWLYRSSARGPKKGEILCLKVGSIYQIARVIIQRHGLLADNGSKLRVTFGRLRKTMEQRLWKLSDGDLLAVAAVMGHSPQVADNHYLSLDEETKAEGAKFIGDALPAKLRGINLTPTPTGSCKDSLHGANAPKNGISHCAEFTHCFSCPSYAIVGTIEDLHRLFSFQQFLIHEMDYYSLAEWTEWKAHHRDLIARIDQITSENFNSDIVSEAKTLAKANPHKFWSIRIHQSQLSRGVRIDG
jgi:hypothetical protein